MFLMPCNLMSSTHDNNINSVSWLRVVPTQLMPIQIVNQNNDYDIFCEELFIAHAAECSCNTMIGLWHARLWVPVLTNYSQARLHYELLSFTTLSVWSHGMVEKHGLKHLYAKDLQKHLKIANRVYVAISSQGCTGNVLSGAEMNDSSRLSLWFKNTGFNAKMSYYHLTFLDFSFMRKQRLSQLSSTR